MKRLILDNFLWKRPRAGIEASILCCGDSLQDFNTFLLIKWLQIRSHPPVHLCQSICCCYTFAMARCEAPVSTWLKITLDKPIFKSFISLSTVIFRLILCIQTVLNIFKLKISHSLICCLRLLFIQKWLIHHILQLVFSVDWQLGC